MQIVRIHKDIRGFRPTCSNRGNSLVCNSVAGRGRSRATFVVRYPGSIAMLLLSVGSVAAIRENSSGAAESGRGSFTSRGRITQDAVRSSPDSVTVYCVSGLTRQRRQLEQNHRVSRVPRLSALRTPCTQLVIGGRTMLTARTTWNGLVTGDASANVPRAAAYPQLGTILPHPFGNGTAAARTSGPDRCAAGGVAAGAASFHFSAFRREQCHRAWVPGESAFRRVVATSGNRHVRGGCETVKSLVGGISAVASGASSSPNSSGTGEFPYPFTTN